MKSKAILQIVHDMLLAYQRGLAPGEPDEAVARITLAVERELQVPQCFPTFNKCSPWYECPVFRRVEALEKRFKQHQQQNCF